MGTIVSGTLIAYARRWTGSLPAESGPCAREPCQVDPTLAIAPASVLLNGWGSVPASWQLRRHHAAGSRSPAGHGGSATGIYAPQSADRGLAESAMGNHESAGHAFSHRRADADGNIAEPDAEPSAGRRRDANSTGTKGVSDPYRRAGRLRANSGCICAGGDWREPRVRRAQRRQCTVLGRQ